MATHEHIHDETCQHEHDHATTGGINWGRVQLWLQTGLMFFFALYLIDLALPGGNLSYYINVVDFGWLVWVGAAILLLIVAINVYDLLRYPYQHEHHHHNHDEHHDHDHVKAGGVASWVFLSLSTVPLLLGLGVPPQPLGANAVTGELATDVASIGFGQARATTAEIAPQDRNLLDWIRLFSSSADIKEFEGQPVNLIGFVYRDARFAGTSNFMVVRFTLSCCVADARPLGLMVEDKLGLNLAQDTWVKVQGTITIRNLDGVLTPIIVAETLEITTQPEQPYLYF
jgi:uncharacterized repeat protein (TIGR03943 family)